MTNAVNLASAAGTGFAFRNRIINGDMRIDQRNGGASVTPGDGAYTLDRWRMSKSGAASFSVQQVSDAPSGFNRSLKITVTGTQSSPSASDLYAIAQQTELSVSADLSGQPFVVSFWVKSSVTGTYSLAFSNAIGDPHRREYIGTYTINSANTWEYKTVFVPTNAWDTGQQTYPNGYGLCVIFVIGCGSNRQYAGNVWYSGGNEHLAVSNQVQLAANSGATFFLTGVQFEVGTVATPFERRPFGLELALCQRYFEKSYDTATVPGSVNSLGANSVYVSGAASFFNGAGQTPRFAVEKRTNPTITIYSNTTGASNRVWDTANNTDVIPTVSMVGTRGFFVYWNQTQATMVNVYFQYVASAEL